MGGVAYYWYIWCIWELSWQGKRVCISISTLYFFVIERNIGEILVPCALDWRVIKNSKREYVVTWSKVASPILGALQLDSKIWWWNIGRDKGKILKES